MKILVVDSQGGGIGKQVIAAIKGSGIECEITAAGTNSAATVAMIKAGADHGATGENAIVVGCRHADVIIGPIGIVIADAMYGEITPKMAQAIGQSFARRILIPINTCDNKVVGVTDYSLNKLINEVLVSLSDKEC